jgi:uncharacterized membrane protein YhaH (DUF805 family)
MVIERLMIFATISLPSVLIFYPLTFLIIKKVGDLSLSKFNVFIGFILTWFFSAMPGFLYGNQFHDENPGAIILIPIIAIVIIVFMLKAISSSENKNKTDAKDYKA